MNRSVLVLLAGVSGCNWLSLGKNALTYDTLQRGAAGNVAVRESIVYVTLAENGFAVVDASSGRTIATVAPSPGSETVDDVAIAGELLFALDARAPGRLSVYSLHDPRSPKLVGRTHDVPVGPFSGISASGGVCVVSGGTSALTVWQYDSTGMLGGGGPLATTDLGRGQPDVLLSRDGRIAFVSTHYWGPYFGVGVIALDSASRMVRALSQLDLEGAGFTEGGAKPANFPIEMAQLGDSALLVAFARGLAVIEVARPEAPRLTRVVDVGGPAVNVDVEHRTAAVAVTGESPAIVLVSFASSEPRVVRRIAMPRGTNPSAVTFSGRRIVVAARDQGVIVVDR